MRIIPCFECLPLSTDFKDFNILMIGRLLGGVSTSLLFSIFEAWLIRSHSDAQVQNYVGKSFSWAAFSNSIVAVITGLVANRAAESFELTAIQDEFLYVGGYLSPFDIALVTSLMTSTAAYLVWEENYGEKSNSSGDGSKDDAWYEGLRSAYLTMMRSQDILLCGIISSLFEGSMYVSWLFANCQPPPMLPKQPRQQESALYRSKLTSIAFTDFRVHVDTSIVRGG